MPEIGAHNGWMASGLDLYQQIGDRLTWVVDHGAGDGRLIETHPTYAFKEMGWDIHVPELSLRNGIDWIDATICALVACWKSTRPQEVLAIGDDEEGSIFLRFPQTPYDLPDAPALRPTPAEGPGGENAVLLRLGANGPGGMTQQDTIDLTLHALEEGECWVPVGSTTNFNLADNLGVVNGNLYLAFGDTLRLCVRCDQCLDLAEQEHPYPGDHENPWPVDSAPRWIRADNVLEVNIQDFSTRHAGQWQHGFANQRALLWGQVNGGPPANG